VLLGLRRTVSRALGLELVVLAVIRVLLVFYDLCIGEVKDLLLIVTEG